MKAKGMIEGKEETSIDDFVEHPVWRYDLDRDMYFPLLTLDTLINSADELHFFAKFITPQGYELRGSIAGKGDTAIAIFQNGRWYAANKRLRQASMDQLDALVRDSANWSIKNGKELLPLQFTTTINKGPYIDWSGIFNIS